MNPVEVKLHTFRGERHCCLAAMYDVVTGNARRYIPGIPLVIPRTLSGLCEQVQACCACRLTKLHASGAPQWQRTGMQYVQEDMCNIR